MTWRGESNRTLGVAKDVVIGRRDVRMSQHIFAEDLDYNIRIHAGRAYVTMVSIDKYGKSMEVPQLLLETEEDHQRFKQGEARMISRLREAGKL